MNQRAVGFAFSDLFLVCVLAASSGVVAGASQTYQKLNAAGTGQAAAAQAPGQPEPSGPPVVVPKGGAWEISLGTQAYRVEGGSDEAAAWIQGTLQQNKAVALAEPGISWADFMRFPRAGDSRGLEVLAGREQGGADEK